MLSAVGEGTTTMTTKITTKNKSTRRAQTSDEADTDDSTFTGDFLVHRYYSGKIWIKIRSFDVAKKQKFTSLLVKLLFFFV